MKVTVYPQLIDYGGAHANTYVRDFVGALKENGVTVANGPHKNPLFSLLPKKVDSDVYIFHWLENVPDYKYGLLQTVVAIWLMFVIKLKGKKLVWFLHNKQPHAAGHRAINNLIIKLLVRKADLIVTHATEGLELIRQQYPAAASRTVFLHHPTKNRLDLHQEKAAAVPESTYRAETGSKIAAVTGRKTEAEGGTDLLLWGNISLYKGVLEFVRYAVERNLSLRIKIIGKCSSADLYERLKELSNEFIHIENRSISFDELGAEIRAARFVLIPYAPQSVLSSGLLMDSLSFGAAVIGPDVGSFRDYAREKSLNVYTFHSFDEIPGLVRNSGKTAKAEDYESFLTLHSWESFGQEFVLLLKKLTGCK